MGEGNVANGIVGEWWDKVIHADGDQVALSVSELADLSNRIDAALRRAKAAGMRLAVQEQRCWEDVLRTEYRNVPTFEAWIDARAAQIEEGE